MWKRIGLNSGIYAGFVLVQAEMYFCGKFLVWLNGVLLAANIQIMMVYFWGYYELRMWK